MQFHTLVYISVICILIIGCLSYAVDAEFTDSMTVSGSFGGVYSHKYESNQDYAYNSIRSSGTMQSGRNRLMQDVTVSTDIDYTASIQTDSNAIHRTDINSVVSPSVDSVFSDYDISKWVISISKVAMLQGSVNVGIRSVLGMGAVALTYDLNADSISIFKSIHKVMSGQVGSDTIDTLSERFDVFYGSLDIKDEIYNE